MDNSALVSEEEKNNLYNKLSGELLIAVDSGAISFESAQEASEYILANVDDIQSHEDLQYFMQRLIEQWPIFQGANLPYQEQQAEVEDQQNIQQVKEQLQQAAQ